jgi:hypothetical protein
VLFNHENAAAQLTAAMSQVTSLTMTTSQAPSNKAGNASVPYKTTFSSAGLLLVLAMAVSLSFVCGYFHSVIQQTLFSEGFLLSSPLQSLNQERVGGKAHGSNYKNSNSSYELTQAPIIWSTATSHGRSVSIEYDYYHESLIHPAMVTHDNPQRVAILWGVGTTTATIQGASAILRQVLKHNTVEQVVLLSMDLNHTVRFDDFLRTEYQDDPRVKIVDEDGLKWFTEFYSDNEDKDLLFDVIVVDMS